MTKRKILALCGGVGGAKLAYGLSKQLSAEALSIVVNTGDDFKYSGFHISPDIDTVMYTLAGINNKEQGWGIQGETWSYMEKQKALGLEHWFLLGDKDLLTHVYRTEQLKLGKNLSEITTELFERHGVHHPVIPMTNDTVSTKIVSKEKQHGGEILDFQEYFVKLQCQPEVQTIFYQGIEDASASPAFNTALQDNSLEAIIICPSNPFLSIDPILNIPEVKTLLKQTNAKIIAVSPIISGQAIKGPTSKIMKELGLELSNLSIAQHYQGVIDTLIIDEKDSQDSSKIEALGLACTCLNTYMKTEKDKTLLAQEILSIL